MEKIHPAAIKEINELASQERKIREKIEIWYIENVQNLVNQCTTFEELDQLFGQIQIVDEQNQIKDLPGFIGIYKCFAYDKMSKTQKRDK